jgi:peptidyl-dipeptidase Dcp
MRSRLALAISAALTLALAACSNDATDAASTAPAASAEAAPADGAAQAADNPFFQASTLQYEYPPFDRIRDEHYAPALERGMAEQIAEIRAIADSAEPATFENTIVAMERSGATLNRVSAVFFNLAGANTNPVIDQVQAEFAPKLAAHMDAILLDGPLFARVKSLHEQRDTLGLDPESLRLLERYHTDFVRAGAQLDDAQKAQLRTLNAELASLQTAFSQAVLAGVNAAAIVVDTREELAGLSDNEIAAAAAAAEARGLQGKYVIALLNTSGQPALASLTNRALRSRIMAASLGRGTSGGEHDTTATIARIVRLRAERAQLLGYPSHAAYVLEDATAGTVDVVNRLMADMAPAARANAEREAADMQAIVDAEGGGFQVGAEDWALYAERVRTERYAFDAAQLRPYFELNRVLEDGVFHMAKELYGLEFRPRTDLPVYQEDVKVWEVFDRDGTSMGLFIGDWYARSNKRGGAWMNEYVGQSRLLGGRPVVGNHLNIPKPPAGEPTLLTFDETTTLFHEFGHALHGLFSDVNYPRFSGTSVPRDFVEFPSQVHEMWATWPSVLANYARHYQTGEPIPQDLLDKVMAAEQFGQGHATTEYLAAAMLDQAFHQITPDQAPTADQVLAFEAAALQRVGLDYAPVPPRYRSGYFSHTFAGGYSAGYYSYLWSEVLDADTVQWFNENGGLSRENGDRFRALLLSRGGSVEAMQLFRDFRGRDPDVAPLLARRGLAAPEATE